jgi:hypothetical protein
MLRRPLCTLVGTLLTFLACLAQAPAFDYPILLYNSSGPIVNGNAHSAVTVGDWDGDGDADLMAGVFYHGNVHYFPNIAPPGSPPTFGLGTLLAADGAPIQVTYG